VRSAAKSAHASLIQRALQLFLPFDFAPVSAPASGRAKSPPRDFQRSKVYASEKGLRRGNRFNRIEDCQRYVDLVIDSPWWRTHCQTRPHVQVRDGRGRRHAGAYDHKRAIALPKWSRSELIILHELAHIATPHSCAAHGAEFARNYVDLVRFFMGERAGARLENAFRANRVRIAGDGASPARL
jgi:putative metallohydrolase (TIGR04338 family)